MSHPPPPPSGPEGPGDPTGGDQPVDPSGSQGIGYPPPGGQYPPPGPYPSQGQSPSGYGAPAGNNSKAVLALVFGIIGLPFAFCCAILGLAGGVVGIVVGRKARTEIAASGGVQGGDGMAKAGYILGIVDVVIAAILIAVQVVAIATGNAHFTFNTTP